MKSLAYCPNRRDSAKPAGAFHDWANLNLAKRRLCDALGTSLGSAAHCCAISVARVRAALTAAIPRSSPDFDGCDLVGVVSIIMGHAKL